MKALNKLLLLTAAGVVLNAGTSTPVSAQQDLGSWYQVDVIVFTPRRSDLDDESWPELERSYPANMIAIAQGEDVRPMRLSQLEQLGSAEPLLAEDEPVELIDENTFLFESQSRGSRNRRLVESMIRQESDEAPDPVIVPGDAASRSRTTELMDLNPDSARLDDSETDLVEEEAQSAPENIDALFANLGRSWAYEPRVSQSSLASVARSLNRSSRFDMLSHNSWVQPISSSPTPVLIQTGDRYDDVFEIEGTLSFSRSRYIHVQSDLWYTTFEARYQNQNPFKQAVDTLLDDETLAANKDLVEVERNRGQYVPARTHVMFQSRRMRSGELHYLDHPLFGVIVRVNRHTVETSTGD